MSGTVKILWLVIRWIVFRPDISETVDWALKNNYLPTDLESCSAILVQLSCLFQHRWRVCPKRGGWSHLPYHHNAASPGEKASMPCCHHAPQTRRRAWAMGLTCAKAAWGIINIALTMMGNLVILFDLWPFPSNMGFLFRESWRSCVRLFYVRVSICLFEDANVWTDDVCVSSCMYVYVFPCMCTCKHACVCVYEVGWGWGVL